MADQQFSQFTNGNTPLDTDFVSGYLGTAPGVIGSNRRWQYGNLKTYIFAAATFDKILAGTNAHALVVGTGGSLATSGSGTITATGLSTVLSPASGGTGIANNAASTLAISGNFATTLTVSNTTNVTLPTSGTLVNSAVTTLSSLASIGTINTGVWNGTIVNPTYGGTGVNNGSNTVTATGNATVNQDTRTTATPSFAGATLTTSALTQLAVTANTSTAYTIDPANGAEFNLTMNSATPAITLQTPVSSVTKLITLVLLQDATGGRVPSWAGVTWASGTTPAINSAPNAATYLSFLYTGTSCIGFATPIATGSGNVVLATSPSFTSSFTTAPAASSVATTAFGTSLTLGTAIQNTTGYDLLVHIAINATVATTATIIMGVGSTSTPTTNTAIPSFSVTGTYVLSAYVPNNYYLLVDKTGTLTSTNNIVAMGI